MKSWWAFKNKTAFIQIHGVSESVSHLVNWILLCQGMREREWVMRMLIQDDDDCNFHSNSTVIFFFFFSLSLSLLFNLPDADDPVIPLLSPCLPVSFCVSFSREPSEALVTCFFIAYTSLSYIYIFFVTWTCAMRNRWKRKQLASRTASLTVQVGWSILFSFSFHPSSSLSCASLAPKTLLMLVKGVEHLIFIFSSCLHVTWCSVTCKVKRQSLNESQMKGLKINYRDGDTQSRGKLHRQLFQSNSIKFSSPFTLLSHSYVRK